MGNCSFGLPMASYYWLLWLGESLLANDFMSTLFKLVAIFSIKIILIKKEICCLSDLGQNTLNSHKFPIYKISISFSSLFNLLGLLNGIKYMKFYKSCEKPYKYKWGYLSIARRVLKAFSKYEIEGFLSFLTLIALWSIPLKHRKSP